MRLSEVERSHVAALHHRMRDKPYQANQARNVLAKMFRLAEAWGFGRCRGAIRACRFADTRSTGASGSSPGRITGGMARLLDEAEADG